MRINHDGALICTCGEQDFTYDVLYRFVYQPSLSSDVVQTGRFHPPVLLSCGHCGKMWVHRQLNGGPEFRAYGSVDASILINKEL